MADSGSAKGVAHLHRDQVRIPIYVCRGEAEQAKAGADEAVLAAVVIHQPIAVVAAVVFDCQAVKSIEQVWPAQETALVVMDRNLSLRRWEPGKHEEHPQPGLHCGLGFRLRQLNNPPNPGDALYTRMLGDVGAQFGDGDQPGMKEQIRSDDSFGQWISASEVDHRTECRRGRQSTAQHDLAAGERGSANARAGTAPAAHRFWDRDLDRIAGRYVQSM